MYVGINKLTSIGIIWSGWMSLPILRSIMKYYPLSIYSNSLDKAQSVIDEGATWTECPMDVVNKSDCIILVLPNEETCREVFDGDNGLFSSKKENVTILNMSTISPNANRKYYEKTINFGWKYVEAPLNATLNLDNFGSMMLLVGGEKRDIDLVMPILELFGKNIECIDEIGKASEIKLLINANMAVQTAILAETLTVANELDINLDKFLDLMNNSVLGSSITNSKGYNMSKNLFPTDFPLKYMAEDLKHYEKIRDLVEVNSQLSTTTRKIYDLLASSDGDLDFSAVRNFF
jgi:3-hydroxyisobutyrate dehydrogenase